MKYQHSFSSEPSQTLSEEESQIPLSLLDISQLPSEFLFTQRFKLCGDLQSFSQKKSKLNVILQINVTGYNNQNKSELMLQIIDISNSVSLNEKLVENEMLEIVNASTSHELKNPLSSMIAQNMKKEVLF